MKLRSSDAVLAAVVISVIVHIGLMLFIRQRVMTHVAGVAPTVRRAPMQFNRSRETPPPVSLEEILDLKPLREEPRAQPAELPTVNMGAETESALTQVPEVATEFPAAVAPAPKFEVSAMSVEAAKCPVITRLETPSAMAAPARLRPAAAPLSGPSLRPSAPVTSFGGIGGGKAAVVKLEPPAPAPEFQPSNEVYAEVDRRTVEAEKAAVKALVDSSSARELAPLVDLTVTKCEAGDGMYFRLAIKPREGLKTVAKDVVLIIDASGSIGADRMISIRKAAKRILRSCANTGDRFNLVAFRERYQYAFRNWQECTQRAFDQSDKWIGNLAAHGRTDVFSTIESILTLPRDPQRPLIALVVTDGDANCGISSTAGIVSKFTELNDGLVSVYMYGVKSSANRELMEGLTRGNRGESFVFEGFRWSAGEGIEGLTERFRDPVLSDLRMVFAAADAAEAYPRRLRNLYRGGQVELVGKVPVGVRQVSFSLKGLNGAEAYESFFTFDLGRAAIDPALPSAWREERKFDFKTRKEN